MSKILEPTEDDLKYPREALFGVSVQLQTKYITRSSGPGPLPVTGHALTHIMVIYRGYIEIVENDMETILLIFM